VDGCRRRNNRGSGLIDDAHVQGFGMQIDTAIECGLRDIKSVSENMVPLTPNPSPARGEGSNRIGFDGKSPIGGRDA
jgi:hypothetical protein